MPASLPASEVARLQELRGDLLDDIQKNLGERAARTLVVTLISSVEPLVDALLLALREGNPEALREAALRAEMPLDAALLALFGVRRAALRQIRALNNTETEDCLEAFAEDAIELAATALARQSMAAKEEAERAGARARAHESEVFQRLPAILHAIDAQGRLIAVNDRWVEAMGYTREEALGRRSSEFLTPESARYAREVVLPAFFKTGRCDNVHYQFVRKDGSVMDVVLSGIVDQGVDGETTSRAVLTDVTEWLASERSAKALAVQAETLRAQREMLLAISTPLVPLGDGVLLMPLVGNVDRARAERIMSVLLEGIGAHAAEAAIVDVTGVPTMDEAVAEAILHATKAVGLLGARVVLTGLSPAAARTLVDMGLELGGMTTKATLRDGLAAARAATSRFARRKTA